MVGATPKTIVELMAEAPFAARWELVRPLPADALGSRVLAKERPVGRLVTARAFAIDDGAWPRMAGRLEALAGVRHKKISSLLAHGRHGPTGWVVHEHHEGLDLGELLREHGQLGLAELVPIASQILMGVGDAHLRGLVVGGVRPHEVTLHEDGGRASIVKLRDFGLWAGGLWVGGIGSSSGAADDPNDYRSPEADATGDPASDVFSLGALFVRLLSGPLPSYTVASERGATLRARLALRQRLGPPLPDALVDLLHRTLDPEPEARPHDANQLVEELIDAVPMAAFRLPRAGEDPARELGGATAGASSAMLTVAPSPSTAPHSPPRRLGWMIGAGALSLAVGIVAVLLLREPSSGAPMAAALPATPLPAAPTPVDVAPPVAVGSPAAAIPATLAEAAVVPTAPSEPTLEADSSELETPPTGSHRRSQRGGSASPRSSKPAVTPAAPVPADPSDHPRRPVPLIGASEGGSKAPPSTSINPLLPRSGG